MKFKEDYEDFVNAQSNKGSPFTIKERAALCVFVAFLEKKYRRLPLVREKNVLPEVRDEDIPPMPPVKPPKHCPSNHSLLKLSGHATCPDCKIILPRIGERYAKNDKG